MMNVRVGRRVVWALMTLALASALVAGCGALGGIGGGGTGSGPTGSGAGSAGVKPLPCKGRIISEEAAPAVTLRSKDSSHTASAAVGSVVEFRLAGSFAWTRVGVQPSDAMIAVGAQGAYLQGDCVWDFKVARAGDIVVAFTGGALCAPNEACPQYALLASFTIHGY